MPGKNMMRPVIETLELWFRHYCVYPLLRLILRNPASSMPLKLLSIHRILILRYDRLGDMIVTTPLFRLLKTLNPQLSIGVFASRENAELIRCNPFVDDIFVLESHWFSILKEILRARNMQYDVVLNFIFNRTTSGALLANIIAPHGYKVGQGDEKYRFYYNRLLKLDRSNTHMIDTLYSMIQQVFEEPIGEIRSPFEIYLNRESEELVDTFLQTNNLRRRGMEAEGKDNYLVFNLSATDSVRRISTAQASGLIEYFERDLREKVIYITAPKDSEMRDLLRRKGESLSLLVYPQQGTASLLEIASLLEGALLAITPDTSIIHFSSAMHTPVLGFFTPLQGMHEWLPYQVPSWTVQAEPQQPVSSIPVERMISAAKVSLERINH